MSAEARVTRDPDPPITILPRPTGAGALIAGVDPSRPMAPETRRAVEAALHRYKILVFRAPAAAEAAVLVEHAELLPA